LKAETQMLHDGSEPGVQARLKIAAMRGAKLNAN